TILSVAMMLRYTFPEGLLEAIQMAWLDEVR
ncbi:hypothetical protein OPU39_04340, partial [Acinetobacter nosocomialis]|nr:hypothetical protein [Acinetobacter nosocomialis]